MKLRISFGATHHYGPVPPALYKELKEETGLEKADIIREAVLYYTDAVRALKNSGKLAITTVDETIEHDGVLHQELRFGLRHVVENNSPPGPSNLRAFPKNG